MLQRAAPAHFVADIRRYNELFAVCGAIYRDGDGWQGVDTSKAPADAVEAYGRLLRQGYLNGWL
ncbi:hypothetical protein J2X12_002861 [Pseudarthrobacter oxydans]|uniref:Uncharacterized protein n=1 Tax=Pseudarthrobacter oxydans TaxID=1671 RepID=A0AAW8NFW8_PSEOX|nr:hypothetical protein [Pseudarthrobacter oxydans]MDR7164823.1 hypothetical protein [Pseudarthrobacter oxydans]